MSRGTSLSAAGSTMMRPRSTACSPSFSESASRSVASETKPSCTSNRPTGTWLLVCSSSAMRSWSSVRMPWSIRIWPRWRFAWGLPGEFIGGTALERELGGTGAGRGEVETRAALLAQADRALVILERLAALVQVVEADGEVVGKIRVVRVRDVGLEVFLLRLGPAILGGEMVAKCEVQGMRRRLGGDQRFHAAFCDQRVAASRAKRDQRGLRVAVPRIDLQRAQVQRFRALVAAATYLQRGEPEKRIAVCRLLAQRLPVRAARAVQVARAIRRIACRNLRMHLRRIARHGGGAFRERGQRLRDAARLERPQPRRLHLRFGARARRRRRRRGRRRERRAFRRRGRKAGDRTRGGDGRRRDR